MILAAADPWFAICCVLIVALMAAASLMKHQAEVSLRQEHVPCPIVMAHLEEAVRELIEVNDDDHAEFRRRLDALERRAA